MGVNAVAGKKLSERDVEVVSKVGAANLVRNMTKLYNVLCRRCKLNAVGDLGRGQQEGKKLINVNRFCAPCKKRALDFGERMGVDL
jgi:hypothetical protein